MRSGWSIQSNASSAMNSEHYIQSLDNLPTTRAGKVSSLCSELMLILLAIHTYNISWSVCCFYFRNFQCLVPSQMIVYKYLFLTSEYGQHFHVNLDAAIHPGHFNKSGMSKLGDQNGTSVKSVTNTKLTWPGTPPMMNPLGEIRILKYHLGHLHQDKSQSLKYALILPCVLRTSELEWGPILRDINHGSSPGYWRT